MTELRKLVQEEDAAVAEAYFAGFRPVTAAHQAGVGDSVMGSAERSLPDYRSIRGEQSAYAVNLGDFQGFLIGHQRQYGGERARQQGLAAAGWSHHYRVMRSGRRYLKGSLDMLLSFDIGKVRCR